MRNDMHLKKDLNLVFITGPLPVTYSSLRKKASDGDGYFVNISNW